MAPKDPHLSIDPSKPTSKLKEKPAQTDDMTTPFDIFLFFIHFNLSDVFKILILIFVPLSSRTSHLLFSS